MIAIELETLIDGHRLEISSPSLPAQATKAKIIVLYEDIQTEQPSPSLDIDAVLTRARGVLGHQSMADIDAQLAEMRGEWDERGARDGTVSF